MGLLLMQWFPGSARPNIAYQTKYRSADYRGPLRLNAMIIASQFYHVATDDGYWSKIEVSPFPRCAHIPENQDLIDADVPTFEMNSNFVDDMKNALTLDVPTFAPRS